jgi:glycosyltransferase involved in cell wall biosynthesis
VPDLTILSGISDEELRNEYQRATLLLLPITDCTANNAILEGLACGLPVVTTQVGGIRGYVDDSCAFLCGPGKLSEIVDSVLALFSDRELLLRMSESARVKSLEYSWPVIAETTNQIYHKLLVDA